MLTTEDDCLGVDFNSATPATAQILRPSIKTIEAAFETALRSLTVPRRIVAVTDPVSLI
jgi:hypothetical protein